MTRENVVRVEVTAAAVPALSHDAALVLARIIRSYLDQRDENTAAPRADDDEDCAA